MPEESPNQPKEKSRGNSSFQVFVFVIILSFVCGLLLAVISFSLRGPQKAAKEFDQSKQMLIAAKILSAAGYFEILQDDGTTIPASFDSQTKTLVPIKEGETPPEATEEAIKAVAELRIRPLLTDKKGDVFTLSDKNVDLPTYLEENKQQGYATLDLKLLYAILPNSEEDSQITDSMVAKDLSKAYAFVLPVSGFGLWAPIYGFIAVFPNGDTVIGTTWYDQAETPGLGANISEPKWQKQFFGKLIFEETASGTTDFQTAPIGIIVVKGKVDDVYGTSPKAKSAVDGISGATLTGDGVTAAYRDSLSQYRGFLIKLHNLSKETKDDKQEESTSAALFS